MTNLEKRFDKYYFDNEDRAYRYVLMKSHELAELYKENVRKSAAYRTRYLDFMINRALRRLFYPFKIKQIELIGFMFYYIAFWFFLFTFLGFLYKLFIK